MKDYYYILGVSDNASHEEIKSAHRKLSKKFHPDMNPGDIFFADRFKEIQEAYNVLTTPQVRREYDVSRTAQGNRGVQNNFVPVIEYFHSDSTSFEYNKTAMFTWKCYNADIVTLTPFGKVEIAGQKSYRIKDFENSHIKIMLIAKNTLIAKEVSSTITLENKTYIRLKSKILAEYKLEVVKEAQKRESARKDTGIKYEKTIRLKDGVILQVINDRSYMSGQAEVRINDQVPKDGFYFFEDGKGGYEIRNGKTLMEYYIEVYPQDGGRTLTVAASRISGIEKGCRAWLDDVQAPTGFYRRGFLRTFTVKDGFLV